MSTLQTIMIVLTAFAFGMSVVLFPKLKKAISNSLAKALIAREVADDRNFTSKNEFITPCGKAEGYWENAEIVWVRLVGGKKWNSFEELFRNESMLKVTELELRDIQRRLEQVRKVEVQEMYRPKAAVEYPTKKMLGQDLVVYKTGDIRISDKVMVTIGKKDSGHLDITRIYVSEGNLDDTKVIQTINLTLAGGTKEGLALYQAITNEYMTSEEYTSEDKEILAIYVHLGFYNDVVVDQKAVEFRAGRVYLKAHDKLPIVTPRIMVDNLINNNVEMAAKDEVTEALLNAIPHEIAR